MPARIRPSIKRHWCAACGRGDRLEEGRLFHEACLLELLERVLASRDKQWQTETEAMARAMLRRAGR